MWEALATVQETLAKWNENRQRLYSVVASLAAALVVVAVTTGDRPSDTVGAVARGFGLTSIADWFGPAAPPFLAQRAEWLRDAALVAVLLLLAHMVLTPLRRSRHEDNAIFVYRPVLLVGSPAADTIWLLLLVAAQHGDIARALPGSTTSVQVGSAWTAGVLVVGCIVFLLAAQLRLTRLVKPVAALMYRICVGLAMAFLAITFAGVAFPLAVIGWMSNLESDHARKAQFDRDKERAERTPLPTGAVARPNRATRF